MVFPSSVDVVSILLELNDDCRVSLTEVRLGGGGTSKCVILSAMNLQDAEAPFSIHSRTFPSPKASISTERIIWHGKGYYLRGAPRISLPMVFSPYWRAMTGKLGRLGSDDGKVRPN